MANKDHYAPLDPSEGESVVDYDHDVVYLGPFCDEEHAREELGPLLAKHGARLESQDHEDVGKELFQAELLTSSEGMWVGVEARCARGCSAEFTDYGFQALPHYAEGDETDGPVSLYRIHPLRSDGDVLYRTAAIAEYPGSVGPGDPTDGAEVELCARGNTDLVTGKRLIVESIPA